MGAEGSVGSLEKDPGPAEVDGANLLTHLQSPDSRRELRPETRRSHVADVTRAAALVPLPVAASQGLEGGPRTELRTDGVRCVLAQHEDA